MGKFKNSSKYKYDDEGGDLTNCADCGCLTIGTKGDLCSSCQDERQVKEYGKGLTIFINDEYHRHKLKWPKKKVMSDKEYEKWTRKYERFLEQVKIDDEIEVHEIMEWRM